MTYANHSNAVLGFTLSSFIALLLMVVVAAVADTSLAISRSGQLATLQSEIIRTVAGFLMLLVGGTGVFVASLWACTPQRYTQNSLCVATSRHSTVATRPAA